MTPLSILHQDTVADLHALLSAHSPMQLAPLLPRPFVTLSQLSQRCAALLLAGSSLQQPHAILPLLLDLCASLHQGLRQAASNELDTRRRGLVQQHAMLWQHLRITLVNAPQWTSWGLMRQTTMPMLDPVKSGLPANPFEAYHQASTPATLQSDDAQRAMRALIHVDPVLRPLPTQAIADWAKTLVNGTTINGLPL